MRFHTRLQPSYGQCNHCNGEKSQLFATLQLILLHLRDARQWGFKPVDLEQFGVNSSIIIYIYIISTYFKLSSMTQYHEWLWIATSKAALDCRASASTLCLDRARPRCPDRVTLHSAEESRQIRRTSRRWAFGPLWHEGVDSDKLIDIKHHKTSYTQHTTHNIQHTVQHTTYNIQHTTYNEIQRDHTTRSYNKDEHIAALCASELVKLSDTHGPQSLA